MLAFAPLRSANIHPYCWRRGHHDATTHLVKIATSDVYIVGEGFEEFIQFFAAQIAWTKDALDFAWHLEQAGSQDTGAGADKGGCSTKSFLNFFGRPEAR